MGVKQDIDKLRNLIHKHNILYHQKDAPEISDAEYDALKRQLLELERQHPEFQDLFSPTQTVGATPSSRFKKIKHSHPMLSLNNAFDENDVEDFLKKIRNNELIFNDVHSAMISKEMLSNFTENLLMIGYYPTAFEIKLIIH